MLVVPIDLHTAAGKRAIGMLHSSSFRRLQLGESQGAAQNGTRFLL